MLVCNVSLRPRQRAITAAIAEASAATDAAVTGNVIFASLVDDPASVGEIVDAYLGEIMLEAASASDAFSSGAVYDAAVGETMTAADTLDATTTVTTVTWDAATITAVTLSGGDLVTTNTGTTSADQGAHVAAASGKTTGKYYFEVTLTTKNGGGNLGVGIGTTASTYTGMGNTGGVTGVNMYMSNTVWSNGSNMGVTIGTHGLWLAGHIIGIAVDLGNRKIWFKNVSTGGVWNVNGSSADPATNVGGLTVPAGTMVPFVTFGGSGGASGNVYTAKFGATSFVGTVPSGFTSGWPV